MKTFLSGLLAVLATLMGVVAFSFITIAPAQASDPGKVTICHATGNDNKYVSIAVSKNSIVKNDGSEGGHGTHSDDIIPPFSYNNGGNDHGMYAGKNWVSDAVGNPFIANNCTSTGTILTPNLAIATVQATCTNTTAAGLVKVPSQPANITAGEPVSGAGVWTITFTKAADTTYNVYSWVTSFTGTQTVHVIAAGPGDIYWDDAKGACNLPDTGLNGGISNTALITGGLAIGLGLVFMTLGQIRNKRSK